MDTFLLSDGSGIPQSETAGFTLENDAVALDFIGRCLVQEMPVLQQATNPDFSNVDPVQTEIYLSQVDNTVVTTEEISAMADTEDTPNDHAGKISVMSAIKRDFVTSENKGKTFAAAVSLGAGQAVDRLRVSVVATPTVATWVMDHVLESRFSGLASTATGLAALATFGVVNKVIGESQNYGLEEFPKSVEAFKTKYPALVNAFTDALPGIESQDTRAQLALETAEETAEKTLRERINFPLRRKRALTCAGTGPTPFVVTAAANGYTRKERTTITNNTVADTAIFFGGVGTIISESVKQLGAHGQPELASDIKDFISDPRVWMGVAGITMLAEFVTRRYEKWRAKKQ